jgi:DNA repair protein RadD
VLKYRAMKKDPYVPQCDKVLNWSKRKTVSKAGNDCLAVDYVTEHRTFTIWYIPQGKNQKLIKDYEKFIKATNGGDDMPYSIAYKKDSKTMFYNVIGYNLDIDVEPVYVK